MNPAVDNATDTGYLRPRDPVELWLARQWQEVLGFGVGIRENFFAIGGNSLDAARVINAVLDEFGIQLPLNVMTEHSTVERLAVLLRDQNHRLSGPLVTIQRGDGSRPPLFLVHPANGQVGFYCHLANALGEEFTLFGLQAMGLYSDAAPLRTVPSMARTYLDAIRTVQPAGPYLLGGCSIGAAIAYEIATHLGTDVRLLAAIDPDLLEAPDDSLESADPAGILASWKARDLAPQDETPEFVTRSQRVWRANHDAVREWRPQPYPGTLDVFGAGKPDWPSAQRVHDGKLLADTLRELI